MNPQLALKAYQESQIQAVVENPTAHRTVQLLMQGVIDRLQIAKQHMEQHNIAEKGQSISSAITIIDALNSSLDFEQGASIAKNLNHLYEHMMRTCIAANLHHQPELLDEVIELMSVIKSGWDEIEGTASPENP